MAMLGILLSFLLIFINPFKQIDKARDAQRIQNLKQINNSLDTYYNDNNCYPLSLTFGNSWQQGSAVYMKKIPQDPSCYTGGSCYAYVVDSASCPQWNVIFAKLYSSSLNAPTCTLEQYSNCVPSNYAQSGYNYCVVSGEVDCAYINTTTLPANAGAPTVTPTTAPTTAPTVTPTPTDVPGCSKNYSCTGSPLRCNVIAPPGSGQYCTSWCNGNCP
jgi:type II secretory pathway pseudopilin PulG